MKCDPVTDSSHSEFAYTGLKESSTEITFAKRFCIFQETVGLITVRQVSGRDNYIFNVYYMVFTRETVLVSIEMINAIVTKQHNNKSERLILIAPFFSETAITFCNEKGIDIYTIDIYKKYKIKLTETANSTEMMS